MTDEAGVMVGEALIPAATPEQRANLVSQLTEAEASEAVRAEEAKAAAIRRAGEAGAAVGTASEEALAAVASGQDLGVTQAEIEAAVSARGLAGLDVAVGWPAALAAREAAAVVPGPVIDHLEPASVVLGSPSFTLRVIGTGFTAGSRIVFNEGEEPTTFVSETEVTTGVDMATAGVAVEVPVQVRDGALASNVMAFTFLAEAGVMAAAAEPEPEPRSRRHR